MIRKSPAKTQASPKAAKKPAEAPDLKARLPKGSGRPLEFKEAIGAIICDRIAGGESLRSICLEADMPVRSTVLRWLASDAAFASRYAHAREAQADVLADEMLDIADDGSNDWMLKRFGPDERWVENGESIKRSQIRIATRQWIAEKLKPKKYGTITRAEITGEAGGPIQVEVTDLERARRVAFLLAKADQEVKG